MSQTTDQHPITCSLVEGAQVFCDFYVKDLAATPADRLNWVPMGKPKTVSQMVNEVIWFNGAIVTVLKGGAVESGEHAPSGPEYQTSESAIEALKVSVRAAIDAINGVDPNTWMESVTAPWGMPAPKVVIAQWVANHLCYHDAQLNYIQTLYGDNNVHWM